MQNAKFSMQNAKLEVFIEHFALFILHFAFSHSVSELSVSSVAIIFECHLFFGRYTSVAVPR